MITENFYSNLSIWIEGLIQQKRSIGYKYISESSTLKRFDDFYLSHYPNEFELTQDIVLNWSKIRTGEHPKTLKIRVAVVRELAKYMIRNGSKAFILPLGMTPKIPKYIPYIYSNEELRAIFTAAEQCYYNIQVPYRHYVMPLFFRLLYSCGLRVSEARLLKLEDVDLENGILTLKETKADRHRQVPISFSLRERFVSYFKCVHLFSSQTDYFFPGFKGKPMSVGNIEANLRRFLWQAGISHTGRAKPGKQGPPTVHSFRHTFAVHCLRKWIREGKNINAYMPVLQAYMGHSSYSDTAYYLHLTTDLFPDITTTFIKELGDIIPSVELFKPE